MTAELREVLSGHSLLEGPRVHEDRVRAGGPHLRTAPGFAEPERHDTREARLLAVQVHVPRA